MTDYPYNIDKPVIGDTIANFVTYCEQNPEHLMRGLYGFVRRSQFRWKDADEIYIGPGCYHHMGSTRNRLVWWNAEITFKLGSAGSNGLSDDLAAAADWHYIFIDDTAVNTAATNELVAACFLNDTTEPTWSDTYHGWYTGNDRCIGAVRTSAAGAILEFWHNDDLFLYADQIEDRASAGITTDWSDEITLTVPSFVKSALVTFYSGYSTTATSMYWRTGGQGGTDGHFLYSLSAAAAFASHQAKVICSATWKIDVKEAIASASNLAVFTDGYFFPVGM